MRFVAASCAVLLLLSTATVALAQISNDGETVVDQLAQARTGGDLERAMALFADDAVITIQAGRATQVFAGREQVRAYLRSVLMPTHVLMRSVYRVDGPFVRWTEREEHTTLTLDATVQATVQSGHISMLLYQQNETFGNAAGASVATPAHEAPSLAWAAALGSGFMLVVGFFFRPRRRSVTSALSGRMVRALRLTRNER